MATSPKRVEFVQLALPSQTDKPKLLVVIVLCLLVAVSDLGMSSDSIDRVVAVVNQDIITESELRQEVENPLLNPSTSPEEIVPSPLSLSVNIIRLPPLSSESSSPTIGRSSNSTRIAQQQAS
jgi:hypothetical protein